MICLYIHLFLQGGGGGLRSAKFCFFVHEAKFSKSLLCSWILAHLCTSRSCSEGRVPIFILMTIYTRLFKTPECCPAVSLNFHNSERWASIFKAQIISQGTLLLDNWLICVTCHCPALLNALYILTCFPATWFVISAVLGAAVVKGDFILCTMWNYEITLALGEKTASLETLWPGIKSFQKGAFFLSSHPKERKWCVTCPAHIVFLFYFKLIN